MLIAREQKKTQSTIIFICLLLVMLLPSAVYACQGKVVGVMDGDTIEVMHQGQGERIRLYGVDTPEKRQDFGQRAKQFTSSKVFGKVVDINPNDTDRYGRTVGLVTVDGKYLNEELVAAGMAWVYRSYCKQAFCSRWLQLESRAKNNKIGLWSHPNPIPPWEFRHPQKATSHSSTSSTTSATAIEKGATDYVYHGNTSSHAFHQPGCNAYNCKHCTAVFKTKEEAIVAGYEPCGKCKP